MELTQKLSDFCKQKTQRSFDPQITWSQIYNANPLHYYCWGVSQKIILEDFGLALKVNGYKHKGWVLVTLNGADLYDIHLADREGNVIETTTDSYFDYLNEYIDRLVESGD